MTLQKLEAIQLADSELLEVAVVEAHNYGKERGACSAVGDKHGMMGGPKFDDVLIDYLNEKFGVEKSVIEISRIMPNIPEKVINSLKKGFDEGYRKEVRVMSEEDDDDVPY